jgi:hypothetical protein
LRNGPYKRVRSDTALRKNSENHTNQGNDR